MNTLEQFQKNVFDTIDIDKVVWIDDYFCKKKENTNLLYLLKENIEIRKFNDDLDALEVIEELSDIDLSDPVEIVIESLPTDNDVLEAIVKKLAIQPQPDLKAEIFDEFKNLFLKYSELSAIPLTEWNNNKEELVKSQKTLFFVDLDFTTEGGSEDEGIGIIEFILNKSLTAPYCVLFTHSCQHGIDEEKQRLSIIEKFTDKNTKASFSVLSKSIFNKDDALGVDFKAPEFLKRLYLRGLCSQLAESVSTEMKNCIDEVKDQLNQNSIYELDAAIFYKSLKEGASEFDVLHRIFSLKQTSSISHLISSSSDIVEKLKKLRSIQKIQFKPQNLEERKPYIYFQNNIKSGKLFTELRNNEMWSDKESINTIHSPIRTGDVFRCSEKGLEQSFILLEQSCDLVVRDNGTRKLNEATLVPFGFIELNKAKIKDGELKGKTIFEVNSLSKYLTFQMPGNKDNLVVFDFSKAFNINLNLLDLCVFNYTGKIEFDSSCEKCPELVFLPGWIERYRQLYSKLAVKSKSEVNLRERSEVCTTLTNFSLNEEYGIKVDFDTDSKKLSVNISRERRLNSPFVDVLFRKMYVHKTRLPLEHDFSDVSIA